MDYRLIAVNKEGETLSNLEFGHWVELPEAIETILAEADSAEAIAHVSAGRLVWVWDKAQIQKSMDRAVATISESYRASSGD